jgi:hypothetical protein
MTLLQGGNLGINNTNPTFTLDVTGTGRFTTTLYAANITLLEPNTNKLALSGGNTFGYLYGAYYTFGDGVHLGYNYNGTSVANTGGGTSRITAGYGSVGIYTGAINTLPNVLGFYQDSTGKVGIGQPSPAYRLDVTGDINCTGSVRVNGTALSSGGGGGGGGGGGSTTAVSYAESSSTSQTVSTGGYYYSITNSAFTGIILPDTAPAAGTYWVFNNATGSYLGITITNSANLSYIRIPPENSTTIVYTGSSANYALF